MTFPALHAVIDLLPGFDPSCGSLGFGRNLNRCSWFLCLPARGEVFDPGHQIRTLLPRKGIPRGHNQSVQATSDGVKKILIGGQRSSWGRATLEHCQREIPRLGIHPRGTLSVAIPELAMARDAIAAIISAGSLRVSGQAADMAGSCGRVKPLLLLICRNLRAGPY